MDYACIGEHLSHSFSAEIHAAIGGYPYVIHEVAKDRLDAFMTERDFRGINVTIPYKQDVIPHLSYIAPEAERIGAVNTIVNRDGKLYGYNTDYAGILALARHAGISFAGKKILILGTGGTSKTALTVVTDAGALRVERVSRTEKDGAITYETALADRTDTEIIINTTPVGMFPNVGASPIDLSAFPSLVGVLDAVYNPLSTELILAARARKIPAEGGLYMLVAQGVVASDIFRDTRHDDAFIEKIYREIVRSKKNYVLIGMPGCGKSTVGARLSRALGLPLVDSDSEIEARFGLHPSTFIETRGIDAFRDAESEVIADLARTGGKVISLGGGGVLRAENVHELKKNGLLIYLDRSLDLLVETNDRPLSNTREKLTKLYNERKSIYENAADVTVKNDADPEACVIALMERIVK